MSDSVAMGHGVVTTHGYGPRMTRYLVQDWFLSDKVHQAAGIVSVQLGCSTNGALARMVVRSATLDQEVESTAVGVLDHVIRFDE
jgi:hypothetical protein